MKQSTKIVTLLGVAACMFFGTAGAATVTVTSNNNLWFHDGHDANAHEYHFDSSGEQTVFDSGYDNLGYAPVGISLNAGDTLDLSWLGPVAGTTVGAGWTQSTTPVGLGLASTHNIKGLVPYSVIGVWASVVGADGSFDPLGINNTTTAYTSRLFDFVVGEGLSMVVPDGAVALFLGYNGSAVLADGELALNGSPVMQFHYDLSVTPVPLPAGVWLLLSGLGLLYGRKKLQVQKA